MAGGGRDRPRGGHHLGDRCAARRPGRARTASAVGDGARCGQSWKLGSLTSSKASARGPVAAVRAVALVEEREHPRPRRARPARPRRGRRTRGARRDGRVGRGIAPAGDVARPGGRRDAVGVGVARSPRPSRAPRRAPRCRSPTRGSGRSCSTTRRPSSLAAAICASSASRYGAPGFAGSSGAKAGSGCRLGQSAHRRTAAVPTPASSARLSPSRRSVAEPGCSVAPCAEVDDAQQPGRRLRPAGTCAEHACGGERGCGAQQRATAQRAVRPRPGPRASGRERGDRVVDAIRQLQLAREAGEGERAAHGGLRADDRAGGRPARSSRRRALRRTARPVESTMWTSSSMTTSPRAAPDHVVETRGEARRAGEVELAGGAQQRDVAVSAGRRPRGGGGGGWEGWAGCA